MGYGKFSVLGRKQLPRSIPDPRPGTPRPGTQAHALGSLSWVWWDSRKLQVSPEMPPLHLFLCAKSTF